MTSSQDSICKRLRSLGFTQRQTLALLQRIVFWVSQSGEEWTVSRLKALKTLYIQHLTKDKNLVVPDWISTQKDGIPTGVFGRLFRYGLSSPSPKRVWRTIGALMSYTAYTSKSVTPQQRRKFESAVSTAGPITGMTPQQLEWHLRAVQPGLYQEIDSRIKSIAVRVVNAYMSGKIHHDSPARWLSRPGKSEPMIQRPTDWFSDQLIDPDTGLGDPLVVNLTHPLVQSFIALHEDSTTYGIQPKDKGDGTYSLAEYLAEQHRMVLGQSAKDLLRHYPCDDPMRPYGKLIEEHSSYAVGKISCIQESGYKARFVANPSGYIQLITSKLGKSLYHVLDGYQADFRKDQRAGTELIARYQCHAGGGALASIDMSSATDRFPWELQKSLLDYIAQEARNRWKEADLNDAYYLCMLQFEAEAIQAACKGTYLYPYGPTSELRWNCGQPLGLFASFALFSLCHHALVQAQKPEFYAILGDDLVLDGATAPRHEAVLQCLGIGVSKDKSIHSQIGAEFAGRLMYKGSIIRQMKMKPLNNDSFIEVAREVGPNVLKVHNYLTRQQRRVIEVLDPVLPEVYPLGLNWNTKGLTYGARLDLSEYLRDNTKEHVTYKSSLDTGLLKHLCVLRPYHQDQRTTESAEIIGNKPTDERIEKDRQEYSLPSGIKSILRRR